MDFRNFQFLLQAYNTECIAGDEFRIIDYSENVKTILSFLNFFPVSNKQETICRIALHLDQNSFTGSHSYLFNTVFRQIPLQYENIISFLISDFTSFYPEYYNNKDLSDEMILALRKQIDYDYDIIRKKYNSDEIDAVYFQRNCSIETVELEINNDNLPEVQISSLKNILYDLFINQRDRKTGKQFKKEFHEMMRNSYPYEYIMYSFFSSKIPENSS